MAAVFGCGAVIAAVLGAWWIALLLSVFVVALVRGLVKLAALQQGEPRPPTLLGKPQD